MRHNQVKHMITYVNIFCPNTLILISLKKSSLTKKWTLKASLSSSNFCRKFVCQLLSQGHIIFGSKDYDIMNNFVYILMKNTYHFYKRPISLLYDSDYWKFYNLFLRTFSKYNFKVFVFDYLSYNWRMRLWFYCKNRDFYGYRPTSRRHDI